MNVKGDVYVTLTNGTDVRIPLKECQETSNEWCHHCPDFAAEHADISFGGIGLKGWTMCLIRTEYGEDVWNRAVEAGVIEVRPAEEDPGGLKVLERLSKKQRFRVGPFEPHAAGRGPAREVLDRVAPGRRAAGPEGSPPRAGWAGERPSWYTPRERRPSRPPARWASRRPARPGWPS